MPECNSDMMDDDASVILTRQKNARCDLHPVYLCPSKTLFFIIMNTCDSVWSNKNTTLEAMEQNLGNVYLDLKGENLIILKKNGVNVREGYKKGPF